MGSNANSKLLQELQQYLMSSLQPTQNAAAQESPYLAQIGKDATGFLDQVQGTNGPKDYRNFQPGSFWHMDSLANRAKQRDQLMGAGGQGDAALAGGGNQAFLDLDKQNRTDEFENNYGREFQDNVQGATANAKNTQYQLGQMEQDRRTGTASNIGNLFGTTTAAYNAQPKPLWQDLVLGGIQALPGIVGALSKQSGEANGGRPAGMSGSPGLGTYAGYGGQTYGSAIPHPYGAGINYGSGSNPFSSIRTRANPGR